jgi:hypothetical protein
MRKPTLIFSMIPRLHRTRLVDRHRSLTSNASYGCIPPRRHEGSLAEYAHLYASAHMYSLSHLDQSCQTVTLSGEFCSSYSWSDNLTRRNPFRVCISSTASYTSKHTQRRSVVAAGFVHRHEASCPWTRGLIQELAMPRLIHLDS